MQTAQSKIWIWGDDSISYKDKRKVKHTSLSSPGGSILSTLS